MGCVKEYQLHENHTMDVGRGVHGYQALVNSK